MKTIFRKAITVLGSAALVGATMGSALAASYPSPFTSDSVVVVGANAAQSDNVAASRIVSNLDAANAGNSMVSLSGGAGVTESEVPLGSVLTFSGSDIKTSLTDSDIDGLVDSKISWDDGVDSDDYNVHEEIRVGSMTVRTTFDDNDFEELVALDNDRQLEYRYVFDDAFPVARVGMDNATGTADDLYLTILGETYEISGMTSSSITVVTSEEVVLSPGESVTVDGVTFTLDDLSSTAARVNGETITTSAKKVDGLRVQVKDNSIFYNENAPESGSVTLQIGDDISKTYTDGTEYIGEDEDDPQWVWSIFNLGSADGYVGVKYNWKETDEDDNVAYVGGSYVFPENFGQVSLDGLTDLDYEDFKVYFDQIDLYNSTTTSSTETIDSAYVMVIEASDGSEDAILTTSGSHESNKIYLRLAPYTGTFTEGVPVTDWNASAVELFYSDVNGDVTDAIRPRYITGYEMTTGNNSLTAQDLGDIIVGDTTVSMYASVDTGSLILNFTDDGAGQSFWVDAGGADLSASAGTLRWFGGATETTSKESAEAGDAVVSGTNIGTYDNDVLTYQGIVISEPEQNLDNDEFVFSVPTDRVYAEVSVMVGGEASDGGDAGVMTVTDAEAASMDANMVVVGGSAINSIAADLLGGAYREAEFTEMTDVAAGEALIQSFSREGNTALLVAGYNAEDTDMAVTYLLNEDVDTSVGTKMKVMSATEATVVTA